MEDMLMGLERSLTMGSRAVTLESRHSYLKDRGDDALTLALRGKETMQKKEKTSQPRLSRFPFAQKKSIEKTLTLPVDTILHSSVNLALHSLPLHYNLYHLTDKEGRNQLTNSNPI